MEPSKLIELLGFIVNSEPITIFFPEQKKRKDNVPLQNTFEYGSNGSLREIANVLGMLTSTYQTVLPGPFHYRSLQMKQIKNQVHLTQGC